MPANEWDPSSTDLVLDLSEEQNEWFRDIKRDSKYILFHTNDEKNKYMYERRQDVRFVHDVTIELEDDLLNKEELAECILSQQWMLRHFEEGTLALDYERMLFYCINYKLRLQAVLYLTEE